MLVCSLVPCTSFPTPERSYGVQLRLASRSLAPLVPVPAASLHTSGRSPRATPLAYSAHAAHAANRNREHVSGNARVTKAVEVVRKPVVKASKVRVARLLMWVLRCIRDAETSGPMNGQWDYSAMNWNGPYAGAYQFLWPGTWKGYAPDGWGNVRPDQAPAWVQDNAAARLYRARGLQPWGYRARENCA